jgi:hypothetical protein
VRTTSTLRARERAKRVLPARFEHAFEDVESQGCALVTKGTDLDQGDRMRWWLLFTWPVAVWQSLRARRRLRAYALPAGSGRLTLERVA